jgi:hypothetical protein
MGTTGFAREWSTFVFPDLADDDERIQRVAVWMRAIGDGFFATFDGPARAVRCARAAVEAVNPLGIEVWAGVHTGEVETIDGKVGGLAVNTGARGAGLAQPSEVLVADGEGPRRGLRPGVRRCRGAWSSRASLSGGASSVPPE